MGSGFGSSCASGEVRGRGLAIEIFTVLQQESVEGVHDMSDGVRKSNDALGYADWGGRRRRTHGAGSRCTETKVAMESATEAPARSEMCFRRE